MQQQKIDLGAPRSPRCQKSERGFHGLGTGTMSNLGKIQMENDCVVELTKWNGAARLNSPTPCTC